MRYYTYILSDTTAIKIGKTRGYYSLRNRIKRLQCGNPRKIRLVGGFSRDLEIELHRKYAGFRLYGEWFENTIVLELTKYFSFLYKDNFVELLCSQT